MNETELLRDIQRDLQTAPANTVLYLEGKSAPPISSRSSASQPRWTGCTAVSSSAA